MNNDFSVYLGSKSFQIVNVDEKSDNPYATESNSSINISMNNINLYS